MGWLSGAGWGAGLETASAPGPSSGNGALGSPV